MCGIFGVIYRDGAKMASQRLLSRSAELLAHRGPDGAGIFHEPGIGLVHTRLSLVDLDARSNQPFWDPSGTHCLVYNGEIYNFLELREDLARRGVQFRTTSDTEVLLALLMRDGAEATLPRLQGMFAFAYYDRSRRRLVLARDRFGIKPLFVYRDGEMTMFSSEVKAMRPWAALQPNPRFVISYLMHMNQSARDDCIFDKVQIVPPGALIAIEVGGAEETRAALDLADMIDPDQASALAAMPKERAVDHIDELLNVAVRKMLMADAPVGALCSGGVDSSLLLAIAARSHNNLAIFHADVLGRHSEHDAALKLARHLKLDLKKVDTRDGDFVHLLPSVIYHYETPFIRHPHAVPFMMVSGLVRNSGVKAVLTGEGADECYMGYPRLLQARLWQRYEGAVDALRRAVQKVPGIGQQLWSGEAASALTIAAALNRFERQADTDRLRRAYRARMQRSPGAELGTLEDLSYHLRTLLHRNDTMGMSASVEARFPMLYEPLVKTAVNLPLDRKVRRTLSFCSRAHPFHRDKWVLRQVARRYLPRELSERKKAGFYVSALNRLRVDRDYFRDGFLSRFLSLPDAEFNRLYDRADQRLRTKMMMLESWSDIFLDGLSPDQSRNRLEPHLAFAVQA